MELNHPVLCHTMRHEYIAMFLQVDLSDCAEPFDELARFLKEKGEERFLDIHIQRQDIFEAMHRI